MYHSIINVSLSPVFLLQYFVDNLETIGYIIRIMSEILAEVVPSQKLTLITKSLYSHYLQGEDSFKKYFKKTLSLSYELLYGSESIEDTIYTLLCNYYRNEFFVKKTFRKKNYDFFKNGAIEELPILDSRIDMASIDSYSNAFEIKTKYDSLFRLEKQINDYAACFEMVYVVCSDDKEEDVKEMIPGFCGIISYHDRTNCSFNVIRKSSISTMLSPKAQLQVMTKAEKRKAFDSDEDDKILTCFSAYYINDCFKDSVKLKISKKEAS